MTKVEEIVVKIEAEISSKRKLLLFCPSTIGIACHDDEEYTRISSEIKGLNKALLIIKELK